MGLNYKHWKSTKLFTLASFKFSSLKCNALNEFLKMPIYRPILKFLFQWICLINDISIITNFLRTGYSVQRTAYRVLHTYTTTPFWQPNSFSRALKIEKKTAFNVNKNLRRNQYFTTRHGRVEK